MPNYFKYFLKLGGMICILAACTREGVRAQGGLTEPPVPALEQQVPDLQPWAEKLDIVENALETMEESAETLYLEFRACCHDLTQQHTFCPPEAPPKGRSFYDGREILRTAKAMNQRLVLLTGYQKRLQDYQEATQQKHDQCKTMLATQRKAEGIPTRKPKEGYFLDDGTWIESKTKN